MKANAIKSGALQYPMSNESIAAELPYLSEGLEVEQ